ncbi:L-fucose isomerase, partial [Anaerococcus vaginalis]
DKAYVNIGAISMGIAGSDANALFFQNYLGMRTEWVDMTEILRRMKLGIYDHEEFEKAKKWQKEYIKEGFNINETLDLQENLMRSKVVPYEEEWDFCLKHALIVRDILFGNPKLAEIGWSEEALGKNAIAGGFQGQRQWTDWLPNADFTESIMASTFDWNGPKAPTAFATENDTLNGVAMLFGTLLTNRAPIFSDVRTYWSKDSVKRVTGYQLEGKGQDGIIHLINSGATCLDATGAAKDDDGNSIMKHFWDLKDEDIKAMLDNTDWCQANHQYFRGGGFSSHFRTNAEMPVTMVRVNMVEGVGPTIQIAEGYTVNLPDKESQILEDRTDRTWPTTWFAPRLGMEGFESVYKVMANWGANHGATVYGHVGADFITLASMLRIPVSLHNVEDKDVFRPQTFNGFGTKDLESVDYRACEYFGPLYKG